MDVDVVAKSLKKYGYDAAPIHGDLDQSQRTRTLDGFRDGDLGSSSPPTWRRAGSTCRAVSHVFNFDVPSHAEDYVHRIGRTGRAGRDGKAMMICAPKDEKNLEDDREADREADPEDRGSRPPRRSPTPDAAPAETEEAPNDARSPRAARRPGGRKNRGRQGQGQDPR